MFDKYFVVFGLCLLTAAAAQGSPILGIYEQDTSMLGGRWSESFNNINGGDPNPSEVGNELQAASWNGADLGTQWELTGATVESDATVSDETIGNLEVIQYYTKYAGGTVTLKNGDWTGLGDGDYTVDLSSFSQSTIVTKFLDNVLTITSSISMQGTLPDYPGYEMSYLAAVGSIVGQGADPTAEGYPSISAASGQWGDVNQVQMRIVPEPASLSLLALSGLALVRRKRR